LSWWNVKLVVRHQYLVYDLADNDASGVIRAAEYIRVNDEFHEM
jgi:hypothetical protein